MKGRPIRSACIPLMVVLVFGLCVVDPGCRKQSPSGTKTKRSAGKPSPSSSTGGARKSSKPTGKPKSKAGAKQGGKPKSNSAAKPPAKSTKKSEAKKKKDKPSRRAAAEADKPKKGKVMIPPPELEDIEFTYTPGWSSLQAPNLGGRYRLGFALGEPGGGRFAPRLVVLEFKAEGKKHEDKDRARAIIERLVQNFSAGIEGRPQPTVRTAELEAGQLPIQLIDITGDYQPLPDKPARSDFRIFGAIVNHKDNLYFIRAMGPAKTIDEHYDAIMEFIKSVRATSGKKKPTK